jgi:hypothetical protein
VILAEIKALRDGTDNMSFGLLKKNGEVCEDIQFVSPAQPCQ